MAKERGKVLFYSEEKGEGIIISTAKKKYQFEVMAWNDFDMMPQKGLEVSFTSEGNSAKNIECLQSDGEQNSQGNVKPPLNPRFKKEQQAPIIEKDPELLREKPPAKKESQSLQALRYKNDELTQAEEEVLEKISSFEQSVDTIGENIKLSVSINDTMKRYFNRIQKSIEKRMGYKRVQGRLDYLLAKRFLWTTFNNLQEMDPNVVTLRIKSIGDDLKAMSALYSDFERKTLYPSAAFEEIFLANQKEYDALNKYNNKIKEKLNQLKAKEKSVGTLKKNKQIELDKIAKKKSSEYEKILRELKTINGTYADIVHMIAKLQEEYTQNYEKLERFAGNYKNKFFDEFKRESKKYKSTLIDILNAQAYLLDTLLWKEAKTSKAILSYFNKLPVDVELNTKGYLKYYLNTLDEGKSNECTKELFALYDYLQEVQKDCILILIESAQDAMEYEKILQASCEEMKVKAFIDEVAAFKWAMSNHIKVIVLEEYVNSINAKKFLDFYHNAILSKPKIIVLGDTQHISASKYCVTKQLRANASAKKVVDTVCEVLRNE